LDYLNELWKKKESSSQSQSSNKQKDDNEYSSFYHKITQIIPFLPFSPSNLKEIMALKIEKENQSGRSKEKWKQLIIEFF